MSDAPERIWRDKPTTRRGYNDGLPSWPKETDSHDGTEYVRKDLPPTLAAALEVPEIAAMWHALVTWDAAHRTGKNEPLQVAFELGQSALAALKGGA